MLIRIIGDTRLADLPPGAVIDMEDEHRAGILIRQGYARPLTSREVDQQQAEHR